MNLSDVGRSGTMCFAHAGLAEGTNDSTIKIATTNGEGIDFMIDGIMYYKADTDNIATTVCAEQALGTTCLYLILASAAATPAISIVKGVEVANTALTAGTAVLHWPEPTASTCPIGAIKIATGATAFTVGVDDITDDKGTGTITFYNLGLVPARPMTS